MVGEDGRSGKLANLNNIDAVQSTERCTNTAMLRMKLVTKQVRVCQAHLSTGTVPCMRPSRTAVTAARRVPDVGTVSHLYGALV